MSDNGDRPAEVSSVSMNFVGFRSPPSTATKVELPADQESVAALEYIGFIQGTAREIYQRWETRPDPEQYPYSFLEHAAGQFENRYQGDMSDTDFMTMVELKEFQDAILNPQFISIFGTESVKFWIKDTLESRYRSLAKLQRRRRNSAFCADGETPYVPGPAQDPIES